MFLHFLRYFYDFHFYDFSLLQCCFDAIDAIQVASNRHIR
ncbi:hypothetical protein HMPREF1576_01417 [Gardnerella pickettii JCP7719]|uniref:Uncharacterized protein n=1 Tax=Gardnerella pickettii JCP7719 TaxID=1261061 RepID=S4I5L2_9BIFI|nr:hypothetical protein HMPREF1576_01417 [Gardnerella pickettii JCP7719]